jgi:site-specific recombinase XerD
MKSTSEEKKMKRVTIKELSSAVVTELKRLNYAVTTIKIYEKWYRRLISFAAEKGIQEFSPDICEQWLKDSLGIDPLRVDWNGGDSYERKFYYPIRVCQCLTEWKLHGCLALKKQGKLAALELPQQFKKGFESFEKLCRDMEYSEQGIYGRMNRIKRMLLFLDQHGVSGFQSITADRISEFFRTQIELESRTVATMLSSVRVFFHHLYQHGFTHENLAEKLPAVKGVEKFKIPRVWKQEDVLTILNSIDRGSPVGKRDYALLMLVTRYGLRSSDVKSLKLTDLHWNENVIEIVQSKTRNPLMLPLLRDVGWALIDYLKNGRPPSPHPEVFLTINVPFRPFSQNTSLAAILTRRIREAGVRISNDAPKGLHSLRHTIASTMLAKDVPLPVISAVLGHVTSEATGMYLHTDITHLRECALNPEEVLSYGTR